MNTIYDGSFVLGQTSATNFIAGPGITIDSPSAGTVRIGNDETVLWSGAISANQTATLSENITAFEEIKVYGKSHNQYPWISNVWVTGSTVYGCGIQCWHNTVSEIDLSRYVLSGNVVKSLSGAWHSWGNNTTGTVTGNAAQNTIVNKVIGINRKEV